MKKSALHFLLLASLVLSDNRVVANDPCAAPFFSFSQAWCTQGTTVGSIPSGVTSFPCSGTNTGDVWYKFTVPSCSDSITFELTCGTIPGSLTYGIIYLFTGSCISLQGSGCITATPSDTVVNLTLHLPTPMDTIFIRIRPLGGTSDGNFEVCAYNYCTATSTASVKAPLLLDVYPNPATDKVLLNGNMIKAGSTIEVYDPQGKNVFKDQSENSGSFLINTTDFSSGLYCLKISSGEFYQTRKLLIVR